MKFKARAYRSRHKAGEQNNTEKSYASHLELLKKTGEILDYSFECETLKLGKDCRYTPDFRVLRRPISLLNDELNEGLEFIEFHEVKGTTKVKLKGLQYSKPYIEDDALVKIKTAAELHPYKFILVWKGLNGNWERREIN